MIFFSHDRRMATRVDVLVGLRGADLAAAQVRVFTAFLRDEADVGLAPLQAAHVRAALAVVEGYRAARGLKRWDPSTDALQAFVETYRGHADDTLSREALMTIVARCWHAWGVLTRAGANHGEHLVSLALVLGDEGRGAVEVEALPYGRAWFDASLAGEAPMRASYDAWVEQLRRDATAARAAVCEGDRASHEAHIARCVARLERARARSGHEWFVDWLAASVPATLPSCLDRREYTPFQRIWLRGEIGDA